MPNNKKKKTPEKKDHLLKALKWGIGDSSKVNASTLAKKLPNTAAQLRDGSMDPSTLAQTLTQMSFQQRFRQCFHSKWKNGMYLGLVLATFGPEERNEEVRHRFYQELVETDGHVGSSTPLAEMNMHTLGLQGIECLQKAFDQVTERWIKDGRIPDQKENPFYNVSFSDFKKRLSELNSDLDEEEVTQIKKSVATIEEAEEVYGAIKAAATGVVNGDDQIKNSCWHCNQSAKLSRVSLMSCSQCHVSVI